MPFPRNSDGPCEVDDIVGWQVCIEKTSGGDGRKYVISVQTLDPSTEEHPVPCDCKWAKCEVIKAMVKKQEEEDDDSDNCD